MNTLEPTQEIISAVSTTTTTSIAGMVFFGITVADWALLVGVVAGLLSISLSIKNWITGNKKSNE